MKVTGGEAVFLSGGAYTLGELRDIEQLEELARNRDAIAVLRQRGLQGFSQSAQPSMELLKVALARTLELTRAAPESVDVLVYASVEFRGYATHASGLRGLLTSLGLTRAYPLGLTLSACGGLHAALRVARGLLLAGDARRVLVATADRTTDYAKRPRVYPGYWTVCSDAAASCLATLDAGDFECLAIGAAASSNLQLELDGSNVEAVIDQQAEGGASALRAALGSARLEVEDLATVVTNNYNDATAEKFARALRVPHARLFTDNISRFGHAYAADNLINLLDATVASAIPNRIFGLIGTGPNTFGATILRAHPHPGSTTSAPS